eukprot:1171393-Amphidinium_carterae.1
MLEPSNSASFADLDFLIGPADDTESTVAASILAKDAGRLLFSTSQAEAAYSLGNDCVFGLLLTRERLMEDALHTLYLRGARSVVLAQEAIPSMKE